MVQFFFPIIAALSFGPALALLYFSLARYSWPRTDKAYFDDRWIFGLLAVGIIVGTIFIYAENTTLSAGGGFPLIVIFTILEELIVLVILNFPRLRKKGSGRFYGYSLGTSVAAGIALGQYGIVFSGGSNFDLPTLGITLVYTFGVELLGGATGSIIGYSIERGSTVTGVTIALSLQVLFNFLQLAVFSFRPSLLTLLFDIGALAISLSAYLAVIFRIFPSQLIPPGGLPKRRLM